MPPGDYDYGNHEAFADLDGRRAAGAGSPRAAATVYA
jgi:hypothetical protein